MLNRLNTCELGVFSMMNLYGWSSWSRIVSCEALNDVEDESVNLAVEGQLASHLSLAAHSLRSVRGLRERSKSWKPDETRVFVDFFTFMEKRESLSGSLTGDRKAGTLWYMGLDLRFCRDARLFTGNYVIWCPWFFHRPCNGISVMTWWDKFFCNKLRTCTAKKKQTFSDVSGVDTLWWTNILPWKITMFNGKIHYFYGHFQ